MTREEQILEYANSFKGKGMEIEELKEIIRLAIIDGAKWADNHPMKSSIPSNLDEAELKYVEFSDYPPANQEEELMVYNAFKAGADWMVGQGETIEKHIFKDYKGVGILMYLDEKLYNQGEKVIVQIRKK